MSNRLLADVAAFSHEPAMSHKVAESQTIGASSPNKTHHHDHQGHELQLPFVAASLSRLAQLLEQGRQLWDVRTFEQQQAPWQSMFPALHEKVWHIGDDCIEALDKDQEALFACLWDEICRDRQRQGASLWEPGHFNWQLPMHALVEANEPALPDGISGRFTAGIPGRKWAQINRFAAILADDANPLPVLEWCAGKGHLGRLLGALTQKPVLSLEWQQSLCEAGDAEAKKRGVEQRFVCTDALGNGADVLEASQHAVALHACGELHLTLMKKAIRAQTRVISLSPCCYHLSASRHYDCVSASARATRLSLGRHGLQLPLQHAKVASVKANADRLTEVCWRLGFDSLQRTLRRVDEYLPLPTVRQSQLSGGFEGFCRWGAATKGLKLPQDFDAGHWLAEGLRRQRLTRRLDLVAHLFRPVIEQFLLLDRAALLLEAGYRVSLSGFCPASITPRNALIHAWR